MTRRALRVCIYSHFFPPSTGGVEKASLALAKSLSTRGFDVSVATDTGAREEELGLGFRILRRPSIFALYDRIRRSDVVYMIGFNLKSLLLCELTGVPFVWDHADHDLTCPKNIAWSGKDCSFNPAVCTACLARDWPISYVIWLQASLPLRRFFARVAAAHVFHTPFMLRESGVARGVAIPYFLSAPPPFSSERRWQDRPTVLYVGRLIPEKGVHLAIAAMKSLPQADLWVAGDGWFRPQLEGLAGSLGLRNVRFLGSVKESELESLYSRSSVIVMPSVWNEPFGQVALEAMARGKPLLVAKSGGLQEVVQDGALLFDRGDAKDLATKLEAMLADRNLTDSLGARAREVSAGYEEGRVAEAYARLIESVPGDRRAKTPLR